MIPAFLNENYYRAEIFGSMTEIQLVTRSSVPESVISSARLTAFKINQRKASLRQAPSIPETPSQKSGTHLSQLTFRLPAEQGTVLTIFL